MLLKRWRPKVSKGSEALPPPVADEGRAQEGSEKKHCKRQRRNATIELAGPIGKPWSRRQVRNFSLEKKSVRNAIVKNAVRTFLHK